MKFTLNWLKDHLETDADLDTILEKLVVIGLEVEHVEDRGKLLEGFVVGEVLEARQHPNADRLRVCTVSTGQNTYEVVCGAPNAKTGLKGIFAPIGSVIPADGKVLKASKLRGVESQGMLCSERELMISDEHDGIIELEQNAVVGLPAAAALGFDDVVIDVSITSNRGDCLGVHGIARDLAAADLGKLKPLSMDKFEQSYPCPVEIDIKFPTNEEAVCPVFAGIYIKGVKNRPSPAWMQQRLKAVGLRPISSLVDVTNYISIDTGRPLHVYDADKLDGTIHARLGEKGESFLALDGKVYNVGPEDCVIADDKNVLGFGGIIGGEFSGCTENTENVLVESAWFKPNRIAKTGRHYGINSDARHRFERHVDPQSVLSGCRQGAAMILSLCGGQASKTKIAGEIPDFDRTIVFPISEVKRLSGLSPHIAEVRHYLLALGFSVIQDQDGERLRISPPSWRPDIFAKADVVEEIVRMIGLNKVQSVPLPQVQSINLNVLPPRMLTAHRARRVLASRGMFEARTYAFISEEWAKAFGGAINLLKLANPISTEMSVMRPNLLPGLLNAALGNRHRGVHDCAIFEVGSVYEGRSENDQKLMACGVRTGFAQPGGAERRWDTKRQAVDPFLAKADLLAALEGVRAPVENLRESTKDLPAWYHPGQSAHLMLGNRCIGTFGMLHPITAKQANLHGPVSIFEIHFSNLPVRKQKTTSKGALHTSTLMPVSRDFAFIIDKSVNVADFLKAIRNSDKTSVKDVRLFDVFEKDDMPQNKHSLAIEVILQPGAASFTQDELNSISEKILGAAEKYGAELRG